MRDQRMDESSSASETMAADVISVLLLVGVSLSAAFLALGLLLLLLSGPSGAFAELTPQQMLTRQGPPLYPYTLGDVVYGLADGQPLAIIALGELLLIATPVLRVAASVVLFVLQGDYLYVAITMGVLTLLLVSIFLIA